MSAEITHGFHHSTEGVGGRTVACTCGFETGHHRTAAAAADEWRAHAGLPPVRFDLHPVWCDELYADEACVMHHGWLGMLLVTDDVHVVATLDDTGPDRGLVVTVGVLTDKGETNHRIPLDLTPRPGRRNRKQHALTIERTNGDHLVWRCSCGEVFIQDASDARILPALVDHATGGAR